MACQESAYSFTSSSYRLRLHTALLGMSVQAHHKTYSFIEHTVLKPAGQSSSLLKKFTVLKRYAEVTASFYFLFCIF